MKKKEYLWRIYAIWRKYKCYASPYDDREQTNRQTEIKYESKRNQSR